MMELFYQIKSKYQVNLYTPLYIFKNHLTVTNAQQLRQSRNVHGLFPAPHPTISHIFISLTLYIHHHLFLYPHFFS